MTTHRWTTPRLATLLVPALILAGCTGDTEPPQVESRVISDIGLETPESVLHDTEADIYLVSNINGVPTDEDDNGFIARIAPDGTVETLKWIDGQAEGVTLNAPKGMAIIGDTLFVTDITQVRAFHRVTGEPLGSRPVPGATFLNDLAAGPDGTLYVSDSGLNPDFSPSGTDAVYRFEGDSAVAVVKDAGLGGPNGVTVVGDRVFIVTFGGAHVKSAPAAGGPAEVVREMPGGQLDGVVVLDDGSMLTSSWEASAVYHVGAGADAAPTVVVDSIPSPADIGWDAGRRMVLIPVFQENRLEFHHVR